MFPGLDVRRVAQRQPFRPQLPRRFSSFLVRLWPMAGGLSGGKKLPQSRVHERDARIFVGGLGRFGCPSVHSTHLVGMRLPDRKHFPLLALLNLVGGRVGRLTPSDWIAFGDVWSRGEYRLLLVTTIQDARVKVSVVESNENGG